jgi:hypothetical protein
VAETFKIRRTKYSPAIAKVDIALLKKARDGSIKAARLIYQRFEGWTENKS